MITDVSTYLGENYEVIGSFNIDEHVVEKQSQGGNGMDQVCDVDLRQPTEDKWNLFTELEDLDMEALDNLAPCTGIDFSFLPNFSTADLGPVYTIWVFAGKLLKINKE